MIGHANAVVPKLPLVYKKNLIKHVYSKNVHKCTVFDGVIIIIAASSNNGAKNRSFSCISFSCFVI